MERLHLIRPWIHALILPLIHVHPQCINEEGFRLFLKTYLEVEDFPVDLCQRLFRSFQNSEAAQEDSASEITRRVLARLLQRGPLSITATAAARLARARFLFIGACLPGGALRGADTAGFFFLFITLIRLSPSLRSHRGSLSQGCVVLLLPPGGRPAAGQAGV